MRCWHVATLVIKSYVCGVLVTVNYQKSCKSYRISVHEIPFRMLLSITSAPSVHSHPKNAKKNHCPLLSLSFSSSTQRLLLRASWIILRFGWNVLLSFSMVLLLLLSCYLTNYPFFITIVRSYGITHGYFSHQAFFSGSEFLVGC